MSLPPTTTTTTTTTTTIAAADTTSTSTTSTTTHTTVMPTTTTAAGDATSTTATATATTTTCLGRTSLQTKANCYGYYYYYYYFSRATATATQDSSLLRLKTSKSDQRALPLVSQSEKHLSSPFPSAKKAIHPSKCGPMRKLSIHCLTNLPRQSASRQRMLTTVGSPIHCIPSDVWSSVQQYE